MKINFEEFDRLATASKGSGLEAYAKIIQRLVIVTEAKSGAVWNCNQTPFSPIAFHSVGEPAKVGFTQGDHERILLQVVQQQRSAVVKTDGKETNGSLHRSPVMFLSPLKGKPGQVLELVFPGDHNPAYTQEFLNELKHICSVFEAIETPVVRNISEENSLACTPAQDVATGKRIELNELSRYTHALHQSIDRRLTCANIANETRLLLDCDRVSVILKSRGRFKIVAISGQPSVNHRSIAVQSLEQVASEVLKAKSEFWYPAEVELAPQIKAVLDSYLSNSTTRSLVIHPIYRQSSEVIEDPERPSQASNEIIGGIVYEHSRLQWTRSEIEPLLGLTTQHSSDALRNANVHQELFLYPVWKLLGKSAFLAAPRTLPKTVLAIAIALLIGLFLAFWPADFYVSASGTLVPQHRRLVFPKTAGEVLSVPVEHGQVVRESEALVELKSDELQLRLAEVNGRLETLRQRKSAIERNKFQNASNSNAASIEENLGSLQSEIDSLSRQLESLQRIQAQLVVTSPINGQVITWDVQQKLKGRSVAPQNVLMEVADIEGPWQLELDVEDRRIEHLLRGFAAAENNGLKVRFTLAADPSRDYEGTLVEIANAIQISEDNLQVLRVKVEIDEESLALKQAKTGVSAKIYTGEQSSVGYLWLHEIPRTLNRYVFFYLKQ